ncbi:MAG: nucleoside deaminase [Lentisphaerae bacterium]|nr:nucleoside deaminase [Lentisphaerota bacterium]
MPHSEQDEHFMRLAIREARTAEENGDVPIGAIIVQGRTILGKAHNQVELLHDPTAHAEMIAITQAAGALGDWRLTDTVLYVTKEPCPMCAGAIALARIPRVVFGAADPRQGGTLKIADVTGGVLEEECRALLQDFFKGLRKTEATE